MKWPWITFLWALLLISCDTHSSNYRITSFVPADPAGFSNALYQSTSVKLTAGHRIELVDDGAIFDRLEQELAKAKRSINIVLFIWKPGTASERIVRAVTDRAKTGVTCRIVVDAVASMAFEKAVKPELVAAGCDVRAFRPPSKGVTDRRNHRKIVVIDGKAAFCGGFGISDEWLGEGHKPREWRDTNVFIEGPAVNEMQQAFANNWQEVNGPLLPESDFAAVSVGGTTRAAFVSSTSSGHLTRAERLTQLLIAASTTRVWITNAYFVPSNGLIELLVEKRKQGVDVRVMAAGDETDHPEVLREQRATYRKLLDGGVRIWEYQPSLLHAKTMIVDEHLSVVGSINLDRLSLEAMEEGSLVMSDPRVAAELAKRWDLDVTRCVEIEPKLGSRLCSPACPRNPVAFFQLGP
jgi:cardiolipin synthase